MHAPPLVHPPFPPPTPPAFPEVASHAHPAPPLASGLLSPFLANPRNPAISACVCVCLLTARLCGVHRRVERDAGNAGEHPSVSTLEYPLSTP